MPRSVHWARIAILLAVVGRDRLVVCARCGEDERAGAGAGLERRPAGLHRLLQPGERRPGEAPVLALAVQAGRRLAEGVGERRGHARMIAAW